MTRDSSSEAAKAVVRRNTDEVQGKGWFDVFDELFADDFVDHTPQPGTTPDKAGVRKLYNYLREAFPDFQAEIHWQTADGDRVTTYKTYRGTHDGPLLGIAPTHRKIHFESVDVMRVREGKITDHWGVGNLLSLMQQIGAWSPPGTSNVDRMLDEWTTAWSSAENSDPDRVLALFVDDCLFEDAAFGVVARSKEELRTFVIGAFAAVPDFTYQVTRRLATPELAAIEWLMSGTHKGDLPGILATGKRFSAIRGSSILALEAGKIRRQSDYWDRVTFMKQLGLLPSRGRRDDHDL